MTLTHEEHRFLEMVLLLFTRIFIIIIATCKIVYFSLCWQVPHCSLAICHFTRALRLIQLAVLFTHPADQFYMLAKP